jgi:DNA invertase Pin-like site-specific DNA recombinase
MNKSELVTPQHLARMAIIYIRQSSPHQVLTNQESRKLQYALEERALALGWQPDKIVIIDSDLGLSAKSANHRKGFKEVASMVALGQVGIILSFQVDRLSRNCSDWYPLLDVCGYTKCLIADRDNIYDPGNPNGRLLLGIKGQLSEMELYTIRARLTAGLLNKAGRGELALKLPAGLERIENNKVVIDPNEEVRDRIKLVFDSFLRLRSASKVLKFFNAQDFLIPRRDHFGEVVWKKPSVAAIISTLKNPAYAGAFVYGKTKSVRKDLSSAKALQKPLPMDQWKILLNNKYPAYIDWKIFKKILSMLKDNYAEYDRNKTRGIPRPGAALLHGIVYCGECSHKMVVQYKNVTRYICNFNRQQYGVPVCQYIPADPIDACVVKAFFEVLSQVELDVLDRALTSQKEKKKQILDSLYQQVQRLQYEASLAERQFKRVDPDNRLVAAELERRWEHSLAALKKAEEQYQQSQRNTNNVSSLPPELKVAFKCIGQRLPEIWEKGILKTEMKKALLRCLIDKIVIHRSSRDCIETRIVWKGTDTTTFKIRINVGSFIELSGAREMEEIIIKLATEGKSDEEIAKHLTGKGYRSPMREYVLPNTVRCIRLKHRIFRKTSKSRPRIIKGYLTVPQIAKRLDIQKHWIYDRIHKGTIQVEKDPQTQLYLFPDTPETIEQFRKLKKGIIYNLRNSGGYQDA